MSIIFNNIDRILTIMVLLSISLYFRALLQVTGQAWIKTIAHTATLTILPIVTYVITNVISGNIALSLGMVGALSIVRFRNPVRSPLELSVYFGAITMGITAAVSLNWLVFFAISISFAVFALFIINILVKNIYGKSFFIASFSEGNALSTLNIVTQTDIDKLDLDYNLMSKTKSKNEVTYMLASTSFESLKKIEISMSSIEGIISIQLNR